MEEVLEVLKYIAFKLDNIESEVGDLKEEVSTLKGNGMYNSISDLADKLDEIKGDGLYDSIADVNGKLDEIKSDLFSIDLKID